jgi:hypothetical protein
MLDLFKYEKRPSYAHMSLYDKAIWERFITAYPTAYSQVQYDFRVGDAPAFNTLMDDGQDWEQDKLYRKRIDVLGYANDRIDVIELKPRAGTSTIGQVESYRELLLRDEMPNKKIGMVIITDFLMPNMEYLCKQKGIQIVII